MVLREKFIHKHNITNVVISILVTVIIVYILGHNVWLKSNNGQTITLVEDKVLFTLDVKENTHIGANNNQVYKVTRDGIKSYNLKGEEVWSDTFTLGNIVVKQKSPYIAVGSSGVKKVYVFNEEGDRIEINTANPILYFSVNESGNVVTIEETGNKHIVSAYNRKGEFMCSRTSFRNTDGYPITGEISPDGKVLLIAYLNANEPMVKSTIIGMSTKKTDNEGIDNVMYGIVEKENICYGITFISDDTWVSVGDEFINWYSIGGEHKMKKEGVYSIFQSQAFLTNNLRKGYLPMIVSDKPIQNSVHRNEKLICFDSEGEPIYNIETGGGVENFYVDRDTVTYESDGVYSGYNRIGNKVLTYSPEIDIYKVMYFPKLKTGVGVNKEQVILLVPDDKGGSK